MRDGESNGSVRCEEYLRHPPHEVLEFIHIDFQDDGIQRRYPACFLWNQSVRQYVKIQYLVLNHYLSMMDAGEGCLSIRLERSLANGRPKVIYVR